MYNNVCEWIGLRTIDPMDIVCEMVHLTFPIRKRAVSPSSPLSSDDAIVPLLFSFGRGGGGVMA